MAHCTLYVRACLALYILGAKLYDEISHGRCV